MMARQEKMSFDETRKLWIYSVSSNGLTVYGYGKTQEEAKKNFEKNCDSIWEW